MFGGVKIVPGLLRVALAHRDFAVFLESHGAAGILALRLGLADLLRHVLIQSLGLADVVTKKRVFCRAICPKPRIARLVNSSSASQTRIRCFSSAES